MVLGSGAAKKDGSPYCFAICSNAFFNSSSAANFRV